MKILFSDNTLWGLLNFRSGIINYFLSKKFEIVLVAPYDDLAGSFEIPSGARYIPVELSRTGTNPLSDMRYYKSLRKIYKAEKPDYIFHYTIKPNIYGSIAAHRLGIRSTAMVAGLGHVYTENGMGNRIARMMYRYALKYPEHVMVLNEMNRDTLLKRRVVDDEKLLLLTGGEGVDLEKFKMIPSPISTDRKPVFLMIARLLYEKGYREYVEAASELTDSAEFRIMGPIDVHPAAVKRETIESDVRKGYIKYIGFSPDVMSQIAQANCIVLPSYHEGLSRVLMEAAAMGKPIVTTDIPGCRETVDDGINGFLCQPGDTKSLISAFKKMINLSEDERHGMELASRKKAEEVFDEKLLIRKYEAIIAGE